MENLEMGPQGPEEEKEQTREEILEIIREAVEAGKEIALTQLTSEGKETTNVAFPVSIEGNYLTIEAGGYGFDIMIDSIKKVEK